MMGGGGDPRENSLTSGIVRHDSHLRKSGVNRSGIKPGSPWWEVSSLTAQPPGPQNLAVHRAGRKNKVARSMATIFTFGGMMQNEKYHIKTVTSNYLDDRDDHVDCPLSKIKIKLVEMRAPEDCCVTRPYSGTCEYRRVSDMQPCSDNVCANRSVPHDCSAGRMAVTLVFNCSVETALLMHRVHMFLQNKLEERRNTNLQGKYPSESLPLVYMVVDTSWRPPARSSPSTVTADNQYAVDIAIFVNMTVESSLHRLARLPSTKANRVQSPAGSPDLRKWESCRTMPLIWGFSRESPAPPPLHFGAAPYSLQSPPSALKTSLFPIKRDSRLTFEKGDRDCNRTLNHYTVLFVIVQQCEKFVVFNSTLEVARCGRLRQQCRERAGLPRGNPTPATYPTCENRGDRPPPLHRGSLVAVISWLIDVAEEANKTACPNSSILVPKVRKQVHKYVPEFGHGSAVPGGCRPGRPLLQLGRVCGLLFFFSYLVVFAPHTQWPSVGVTLSFDAESAGLTTIYLVFHWLLAVVSCASRLCDSGRVSEALLDFLGFAPPPSSFRVCSIPLSSILLADQVRQAVRVEAMRTLDKCCYAGTGEEMFPLVVKAASFSVDGFRVAQLTRGLIPQEQTLRGSFPERP
ncbi:hypothetical protein PR048_025881 [Dryococelus australis]|uniref:Uncharacterized protein n=1 Tax=Dryococelus australis TaxID=614101 RepID=A0ABQ9GJT8_9NEOP|nr:hypothetical protein PR048_025881 [Dryococelus australis]